MGFKPLNNEVLRNVYYAMPVIIAEFSVIMTSSRHLVLTGLCNIIYSDYYFITMGTIVSPLQYCN